MNIFDQHEYTDQDRASDLHGGGKINIDNQTGRPQTSEQTGLKHKHTSQLRPGTVAVDGVGRKNMRYRGFQNSTYSTMQDK